MTLSIDIGSMQYSGQEIEALVNRQQALWNKFQADLRQGSLPICLPLGSQADLTGPRIAADYLASRYRNILLLGIGGSALGARTILQFFRGPYYNLQNGQKPRLFVLDNIDSAWFQDLENVLDFSETALVYVSKSGSTPETAASFLYFIDLYIKAGGKMEDVVMVCDPADNGVNRIAGRLHCRFIPLWPDLPGRYTVLSPAGLLPAELIGVDSRGLVEGARSLHEALATVPLADNPLALLGILLYDAAINRNQRIHVLFNYSARLTEFGLWFTQLWGESLGKAVDLQGSTIRAGTTPLSCVGATDQHSLLQLFREGPADKVYGFVRRAPGSERLEIPGRFEEEVEFAYFGGKDIDQQMGIERLSTELSLVKNGCPCYSIDLADNSPASLGALLYFYQALVVWSGRLWNLNPFNQPGVEEGKRMTYALMGRADYQEDLPRVQAEIASYEANRRAFII